MRNQRIQTIQKDFIARDINDVIATGKKIRLQDGSYLPYWLVHLGLFHIEAPVYTMNHVSENNFDQTEINDRQIVVLNAPL